MSELHYLEWGGCSPSEEAILGAKHHDMDERWVHTDSGEKIILSPNTLVFQ